MGIIRRRFIEGTVAGILSAPLLTLGGCDEKSGTANTTLALQSAWVNDAEFIGYFIALSKGWYEQSGVSLNYMSGGPDKVADEVLAARACDVALTTPDGTVNAILKQGAPFKIIATQYQKSPLGIVTLEENNIKKPSDLVGKRLAVPPANTLTTRAFLNLNKVSPDSVTFVPYAYDPRILTAGHADATVDFVTNVPYTIRLLGKIPSSFLFHDFGFRLYMDTVVVREETLRTKRQALIAFLRASRRGWEENFRDPTAYPPQFANSWFKGTGREIDNEKYFNEQQKPLMETSNGLFSMTEEGIHQNIASLRSIGLEATRDMFVTDLLAEL